MAAALRSSAVAGAVMGLAQWQDAAKSVRVSQFCGVPLKGQTMQALARHPSMQRVARFVVAARQGNRAAPQSAVTDALNSFLPKEAIEKFRPVALAALNSLVLAGPAFAGEEPGRIFDFNLTLPIIAIQFLVLMVLLDNIWFKPVSKVMDERDDNIRTKLLTVRDNSDELNALQKEAEDIIKKARAETSSQMAQMKKETAAKLDEQLQASRSKIEKELTSALSNLEKEKEETLKSLDQQVNSLTEEVIRKVVPFKLS